jgi:hypothetical protein
LLFPPSTAQDNCARVFDKTESVILLDCATQFLSITSIAIGTTFGRKFRQNFAASFIVLNEARTVAVASGMAEV